MSQRALLISDNPARSEDLTDDFGKLIEVECVSPAAAVSKKAEDFVFVIVDADLVSNTVITQLGRVLNGGFKALDKVFAVKGQHSQRIQANSLGATDILVRPWRKYEITKIILRYKLRTAGQDELQPEPTPQSMAADMAALQDSFYDSVRTGRPLALDRVYASAEQISSHLRENSVSSWLDIVRAYHSYTYRHCMTVAGLMSAYSLHLGFGEKGVHRMAMAGLLHDVGKVRIPISILDKPGKLTDEQWALIRKHPTYSDEILRKDGQVDADMIDMARHHHEYLDGSGYPDGLKGDEIADSVRIMTIIDIFAALIDKRSYKDAMTGDEAFAILRKMDGKIEMCLVDVFQPIAEQASMGGDNTLADAI